MIIENNVLKCDSQCSRLIYVLAILMKLLRHVLSLTMTLRCLHNNLSGPGVKVLLYFVIELLTSWTEKSVQIVVVLDWVLSNMLWLIWWLCAELNNKWRAYHRSSSSIYSWPLYWIASITESLYFLTQFISSQELWFIDAISWILLSKNVCLVFLTVLLKFFQFLSLFKSLYFSSSLWHSLFHHNFECFVILIIFKFLNQILFVLSANPCTTWSKASLFEIFSVLRPLIDSMSSVMNLFSSLCCGNH